MISVVVDILIALGGRARARHKDTPFESGIESVGDTHIRLSAKFYLMLSDDFGGS
jgi:NADH:ubiquinone oxidoreductase subunit 3 (subunit A)